MIKSYYIYLNQDFRQGHRCQAALTKLVDEWLKYLNNCEVIGIIFIDFGKAYDLVKHVILL